MTGPRSWCSELALAGRGVAGGGAAGGGVGQDWEICILTSTPGDFYVYEGFRTIALGVASCPSGALLQQAAVLPRKTK